MGSSKLSDWSVLVFTPGCEYVSSVVYCPIVTVVVSSTSDVSFLKAPSTKVGRSKPLETSQPGRRKYNRGKTCV